MVDEPVAQDLHVAGEDHQVDLVGGDELDQLLLLAGLVPRHDGDVVEGDLEEPADLGVVRMVRGHQGDLGRQVPGPGPVEEVDQAVVLLRGQDGHPRDPVEVPELDAGPEGLGDGLEGSGQGQSRSRRIGHGELDPLEEAAGVPVDVLVDALDVGALLEQEPRDPGDDPGPVLAHEQQHRPGPSDDFRIRHEQPLSVRRTTDHGTIDHLGEWVRGQRSPDVVERGDHRTPPRSNGHLRPPPESSGASRSPGQVGGAGALR
ncbi:hypothetical protein Acit_01810 [Aciditerrimonas ferrireducens]|nr:hypothetical protein [Aciditerrimonas ferrireducens]MCK4176232.1 hypothetical protein [Aciditerrimonas ferrireducens]